MRGIPFDAGLRVDSSHRMTSDACLARYWIICLRTGCATNSSKAALFWELRYWWSMSMRLMWEVEKVWKWLSFCSRVDGTRGWGWCPKSAEQCSPKFKPAWHERRFVKGDLPDQRNGFMMAGVGECSPVKAEQRRAELLKGGIVFRRFSPGGCTSSSPRDARRKVPNAAKAA